MIFAVTVVLVIIWFAVLINILYSTMQEAPFLPTSKGDVERFIKIAEIKEGQKVYDLGCGDGRIVCAAAKKGANSFGVEISFIPLAIAFVRRIFSKDREKINLLCKNLWSVDLRDADVVYLWLLPASLPKIKEKLERELKKGANVVTCTWPIEGWTAKKTDQQKGKSKMFLYEM